MSEWIKKVNNIKDKQQHEPFSNIPKNHRVVDYIGIPVKAKRAYGGKKVNFALRIEEHLNEAVEQCEGSKNSIINGLIEFALAELKKQNKTLLAE